MYGARAIEDLYFALNRFDIDLIVYFTGDGPWSDKQAGKRMGFYDCSMSVSEQFVYTKLRDFFVYKDMKYFCM